MKSIRELDVNNKRVFLRVDFNLPMKDGKITNSNRIKAVLPTLEYLLERNAKIIIGTHLGRPEGKYNPTYSTIPVAEELSNLLNRNVEATDHVVSEIIDEKVAKMQPGDIIMLGNLRFHPEEEVNNADFAKKLASYAELYINDAFAVCHRSNASVDAIANYLPSCSGLLLESEVMTLNLFLTNPDHPFVLAVGGAKVMDKIGVLEKLAVKADNILLGGAVGNTFLVASGQDMSKSLINEEALSKCKEILSHFREKIILPTDSVKEMDQAGKFNALDIGPETIKNFIREISDAKCIFWNGNMGYTEDDRFKNGTREIAKAMADNFNVKVAAGGDTVGFIYECGLEGGFSFISTGGSATMEYLAGVSLPGIAALERNS